VTPAKLGPLELDVPARRRFFSRLEEPGELEPALGVALDPDLDVLGDELGEAGIVLEKIEQRDPEPERADRDRGPAIGPVDHDVVHRELAERAAFELADGGAAGERVPELLLDPGPKRLAAAGGVNEQRHGAEREDDQHAEPEPDPRGPAPSTVTAGHQKASPRLRWNAYREPGSGSWSPVRFSR
jgi:hypothetical protein